MMLLAIVAWAALGTAALWVVLVCGFVMAMHAKALLKRGVRLHWFFAVPIILVAILTYIADWLWNKTLGSLIFWEGWREDTFSERCGYHKRQPDSWRTRRARWWCDRLNEFDPEHCD